MTPATQALDPVEVGLDAERLTRLDRFLEAKVSEGVIPGWSLAISRGGALAHHSFGGLRDIERGLPVEAGTVFRVYSMAKAVTAVAAMTLYENGAFELNDPVEKFIPSFANMQVFDHLATDGRPVTVPAQSAMTMRHLLTHTSGLTYGFHQSHPVDEMYRRAGHNLEAPSGVSLAEACETWAGLPLLFEPGSQWNYSVATDVLGRVIEVLSGQSLGCYVEEQILRPLGMADTTFHVLETDRDRLATLYTMEAPGSFQRADLAGGLILDRDRADYGGGGLASTTADFTRFATMLANRGTLDDVRILGPRTVELMRSNHLPDGADLDRFGRKMRLETPTAGIGQGFGGSVVIDPLAAGLPLGRGEFGWGGAGGTVFWVDPELDLSVVFMMQVLPPVALPIRGLLHQLIRQAVVA